MTFYERYARCCIQQGIQPASQASAEKLGCSRSNISSFAKSGITPNGDIVAGAAKMLNISADYLLGIVDDPVPINHNDIDSVFDLLILWAGLNKDGQNAAMAMMHGLADKETYRNPHADL